MAHARRTGGIVIKKFLWNKFFTDVARSARAVGFKGGIVQKKIFFWKKHSIDVIYWCAAHAVEGKQKFFFLQKFKKIDVLYWLAMRGRRDEGILKKKILYFFYLEPFLLVPFILGSQIAGSQKAGSQIAGSQIAGSQIAGSRITAQPKIGVGKRILANF